MRRPPRSHGHGMFAHSDFFACGERVIFEPGVMVFHPEAIEIGDDVYVGHGAILKGYYKGRMRIGAGTWVGQQCFLHAAGDITIEGDVGIGPGAKVLTSTHDDAGRGPVMFGELRFAPVVLEAGCDIGIGAIILPGVRIGRGAIVGAGAVVAQDVPPFAVVAGVPARVLRMRSEG